MSRLVMFTGAGAERLPADIALAIIPSLPRAQLEHLVQRLVDRLDEEDGDPDFEDATDAEDDFNLTENALAYSEGGPGCQISDAGGQMDEDGHNSGEAVFAMHGFRYDGPGCPISDYTLDEGEGGIA